MFKLEFLDLKKLNECDLLLKYMQSHNSEVIRLKKKKKHYHKTDWWKENCVVV